jgi:replicative DNA helicase
LDFVLSDSKLSPSIRETVTAALAGENVVIVASQGDFDILVRGLSSLAKTRALYKAAQTATNDLLDSDTPEQLVKQVTNTLGQSLFAVEADDELLAQISMGRPYNQAAEDAFNRILNGSFEKVKIKTGFKEFDDKTGGFHRTNLVVLGANSGGGKSLMAVNLLIRQYRMGHNVVLCSYEMTDEEVLVRLISNIGEVDMSDLQNNRLTPPKLRQATAAWREFNLGNDNYGYERGNGYHIICPKSETTVPEIGFRVRNLKPDVLLLDYINLLGSSMGSSESQWQKLGDISREAKILANKLNCVVILLAQIDDAYNLRYSKAIKDHANFVMSWIRDESARTQRIIQIKQQKARNAALYDFALGERFDIAQFRDQDQEDRTNWPNEDELMMLELRCQAVGLKPEPTASIEYDTKIRSEAKRLVNNTMGDVPERKEVKEVKQPIPESTSLLFSAEELPVDFSKLVVKESALSWPMDNTLYEDTV